MKHTVPEAVLTNELLRFVRDRRPTTAEFLASFGGEHGQTFHVLRKHGVILIEDDVLRLNRQRLSHDGRTFDWVLSRYLLESNEVRLVRWGPGGPPPHAPTP